MHSWEAGALAQGPALRKGSANSHKTRRPLILSAGGASDRQEGRITQAASGEGRLSVHARGRGRAGGRPGLPASAGRPGLCARAGACSPPPPDCRTILLRSPGHFAEEAGPIGSATRCYLCGAEIFVPGLSGSTLELGPLFSPIVAGGAQRTSTCCFPEQRTVGRKGTWQCGRGLTSRDLYPDDLI